MSHPEERDPADADEPMATASLRASILLAQIYAAGRTEIFLDSVFVNQKGPRSENLICDLIRSQHEHYSIIRMSVQLSTRLEEIARANEHATDSSVVEADLRECLELEVYLYEMYVYRGEGAFPKPRTFGTDEFRDVFFVMCTNPIYKFKVIGKRLHAAYISSKS
jgi:hypothetical protein